ncbi:Hypothetical protein LOCK908_1628 [Lacticaseibacillus rhamnosus LOCK908]|nr:hypothetical protein LRHK_1562 [Lacticaseibacillus rhamnosus ATCC 8530]AGP74266.1 Hypothetical protein LOCK908_1628 [Lacticaseibacillus rhamnosus LOCK908]
MRNISKSKTVRQFFDWSIFQRSPLLTIKLAKVFLATP